MQLYIVHVKYDFVWAVDSIVGITIQSKFSQGVMLVNQSKFIGVNHNIIEYDSTLYVGLQLKQNGRPYKVMVRTISKSWQEAFSKVKKVSSIHYHVLL